MHCVGRATAEEARAQGLTPAAETAAGEEEQSARGLLTRLGRAGAPGSVLCVHGRPHRPELADGLRELGAEVTEAVAYAMADWPAPEPLGGQAPGGAGEERPAESAAPALDRQATAEVLHERAADVVLVTSPRQLEALHFLGPLPEPVVCLGSTTAARARELGLAAVTAVSPAPETWPKPRCAPAPAESPPPRTLPNASEPIRTTREETHPMTEQNPQTPARTRLDLIRRPRRLRTNPAMRDIVAETRLHPEDMIQVLFVRDGIDAPQEIPSMPGQHQHTVESLVRAVGEAVTAGVRCIDLFGVPLDADKDAEGSAAWAEDGILNRGIRAVHDEFGDDVVIMADTCLDEFTSHGHCGPLTQNRFGTTVVDNDASVAAYCRMAVSQARAGAHVVSPSGMMDGQIAAIRQALDEEGFEEVSIMAYSAKYASAFFGPFRDAVGSSLQGTARPTSRIRPTAASPSWRPSWIWRREPIW
ncbi:Delta-aminolevulinic acid dehydratase [Rothia kristinae]|nr:Delta-aminolevulinic acid dehydratase [Rothia kristinae]